MASDIMFYVLLAVSAAFLVLAGYAFVQTRPGRRNLTGRT